MSIPEEKEITTTLKQVS